MKIKFWNQLVALAVVMAICLNPSTASTQAAKKVKPGFRSIFQKEKPKQKKEENKPEPVKKEAKKGWFSRNPGEERKKLQEEPTGGGGKERKDGRLNEAPKTKDKKKTTKGRFVFGREKELNKSNKTIVENTETEKDQSKDKNITTIPDDEKVSLNGTETNNTTVLSDELEAEKSNQTESEPTSTSPPARQPPPFMRSMSQPFQPSSSGMILLQPKQQSFPPGGPMQHPGMRQPTPAIIIAEALASVLSNAIRIWFLTSITKWFADEQIKSLKKPVQHFVWERLNDRYIRDSEALHEALKQPPIGVSGRNWRRYLKRKARRELREEKKSKGKNYTKPIQTKAPMFNRTVVVVDVNQKHDATDFVHLEEVVTFIISQHRSQAFGGVELEVVLLMESPGGGVSDFGLGAAQIVRLSREDGITTTACVDKVAASGGYMLASQAHKLLCAPFAYIGSIGVISQLLNYQKVLEKYGVSPIVLTAGDAKAPLSSYGEVTNSGKKIAQRSLTKIHTAFRELVVRGRPGLADSIKEVSDGDVYLGMEAKDRKMVDMLMTSEEYIFEKMQAGDRVLKLYKMPQHIKKAGRLFNPLEFLKRKSELKRWLSSKDIPKLFSCLLQTATFVQFINHVALKHNNPFP